MGGKKGKKKKTNAAATFKYWLGLAAICYIFLGLILFSYVADGILVIWLLTLHYLCVVFFFLFVSNSEYWSRRIFWMIWMMKIMKKILQKDVGRVKPK